MPDMCPKCGLPLELCVCKVLDRETETKIKVYTKKAKFDKIVTVIEGIAQNEIDKTAKELKHTLACGGTVRDSTIELQGNHKDETRRALSNLGYKEDSINVA